MSNSANKTFDDLQREFYQAWFRFHPEEAASVGQQVGAGLLRTYDDDDIGALMSLHQKMHSALDELDEDEDEDEDSLELDEEELSDDEDEEELSDELDEDDDSDEEELLDEKGSSKQIRDELLDDDFEEEEELKWQFSRVSKNSIKTSLVKPHPKSSSLKIRLALPSDPGLAARVILVLLLFRLHTLTLVIDIKSI